MSSDVLMSLRNDKERTLFLDDYANINNDHWKLYFEGLFFNRRFFQYIGSGYCVYIEDELQTHTWPHKHKAYVTKSFYLVPGVRDPEKPFSDYRMSKTQIINWIKEQRRASDEAV